MAKSTVNDNADILRYALSHLEKERDGILDKIASIRQQLGVRRGRPPASAVNGVAAAVVVAEPKERKKRILSPAARKRISAAQKKRWAEARKASE
ncbi:MAG TPA: hypothetical protein VNH18_08725 [Bryobacteraceae bacterium]|nr:hypothetical protein [Bryobacteraceae bacterium]